jgi:hypothetical protein
VKKLEITPDLIIALGMSIALVSAIFMGTSAEVIGFIAGGLSGYLGQVVSDEAKKKDKADNTETGGGQ